MNIVEQKIQSVSEICKQHEVKNLYLFGSVLTDQFSAQSDIDFLVTFEQVNLYRYFDNFMKLKESLEVLLQRSVDLVEKNRFKILYYGVPSSERERESMDERTEK